MAKRGVKIWSGKAVIMIVRTFFTYILSRWNPSYYHSFAMSANYLIFTETPMTMNVKTAILSNATRTPPVDFFEWDPKGIIRDRHTKIVRLILYYQYISQYPGSFCNPNILL